jgi:hypothetical protein
VIKKTQVRDLAEVAVRRERVMANTPTSQEDSRREAIGWLSMIAVMFLFPALFFLCVFFPIWIGLTPRW